MLAVQFKQPGMTVARPEEPTAEQCETIEELFAALESPLLAYAVRLVREIGVAEDIVQDAFMKLHAHFAEIQEPRRWIYRTVHNLALNHRRQAGKIVPLDHAETGSQNAMELRDSQPLPDEQIARLEGIGLVRLCIETLEERDREVIRLKFVEGLSYKEISARTGLTAGHVGYLLHHALKAVAIELSKSGLVP